MIVDFVVVAQLYNKLTQKKMQLSTFYLYTQKIKRNGRTEISLEYVNRLRFNGVSYEK